MAHSAVGTDQPQLEGPAGIQGMGGAGDTEALPLEDPPRRRLHGGVVPDLWPVKLHWRSEREREREKGMGGGTEGGAKERVEKL